MYLQLRILNQRQYRILTVFSNCFNDYISQYNMCLRDYACVSEQIRNMYNQ